MQIITFTIILCRLSAEFNKNVEIPFRLLISTYNHVLDYHVRFYVHSLFLLLSNGLVYQKRLRRYNNKSLLVCHTHAGIIELTSILPYFTDYLSVLGYLFTHHDTEDEVNVGEMLTSEFSEKGIYKGLYGSFVTSLKYKL